MSGKSRTPQKQIAMPVVNPHAAGIDIGSKSHMVCVSQDNIAEYGVCTSDLHSICRHLQRHKITSVALESTGFFWTPLFILLQDYGIEVILVNARHVKNVKGHKTDVVDAKWLQLLHSLGLLSNSFQPDGYTSTLRVYTRHRKSLIQSASSYISKMNKVLVLMNIQLSYVLSDITGESGSKIIQAIIAGERSAKRLVKLVDPRVKADPETIEKALEADWRAEYLFELRQAYQLYSFYWKQIQETDQQIEQYLEQKETTEVNRNDFAPLVKKRYQKNDPKINIGGHAYEMSGGVDLSAIPGVGWTTILTLMSETGVDLSCFPTAKHFASWLGFSPNRKISGGKVLSAKTRKKSQPLALAIKDAANSAGNSHTRLGDWFRSIAYKKGRTVAIIATARKIATIIYAMLRDKTEYCYEYSANEIQRTKNRTIKRILKTMNKQGISTNELNLALS